MWSKKSQKQNQQITDSAKQLLIKYLNITVDENPQIQINEKLVKESFIKFKMNINELNILLGIGGSGPTKRIPPKTFIKVMEKIENKKKCKFFLATGKNEAEQKILYEIYNSKFKDKCLPLDNFVIALCCLVFPE